MGLTVSPASSRFLSSLFQETRAIADTDKKIYAYVILGRILEGIAVIGALVALSFAVTTTYLGLIGLVPAVALGVLGHHLASKKAEAPPPPPAPAPDISTSSSSGSSRSRSRRAEPFVPGQGVGIVREGMNCCMNAPMQWVMNIPSYRAAVAALPRAPFRPVHKFMGDYAGAQRDHETVAAEADSQTIRELLSTLGDRHISTDNGVQEDAAEVMGLLLNQVDHDRPPVHIVKEMRTNTHFYGYFVPVDLKDRKRASFEQMAAAYFNANHYLNAPNEITFVMSRFTYSEARGHIRQRKINDDIAVPLAYQLLARHVESGSGARYHCDAILEHKGSTVSSGHYVAYIKHGDGWRLYDDDDVSLVTEEEALEAAGRAYMLHFSK